MYGTLEDEIRGAFAPLPNTKIVDLHLWQVASGRFAAIISVDAQEPMPVEAYHRLVSMHEELVHVTIQVVGSQPK